ncbi:hypothetical protein KKF23_04690 [Patescibacteria group bacterium]|nr:hypothetical protein [Patescibacteria group bacterium]
MIILLCFIFIFVLFPIHKASAVPPPEIVSSFSVFFSQILIFIPIFLIGFLAILKKIFKIIFEFTFLKIFIIIILLSSLTIGIYVFNKREINSQAELACYIENRKKENNLRKDRTVKSVSLEELKNWLNNDNKIKIFDARLKEEYEAGHLKGAEYWDKSWASQENEIHKTIDKDVKVIFYCTEGVRSSQFAAFLNKYHEQTYYLDDWPIIQEYWEGDMYVYNIKYPKILKAGKVKKYLKRGVVLLDPRKKEKYAKNHIENSVNIPIADLKFGEATDLITGMQNDNGFILICYDKTDNIECQTLYYLIKYVKGNCHGWFFEVEKLASDNLGLFNYSTVQSYD